MPRHQYTSWTIEQWPAADVRAWTEARIKGDTLAPGGGGSHWRASTARTVMRSYGHWLAWLAQEDLLDANAEAAHGVTADNIARYIVHRSQKLANATVAGRISQIYMAVKVMVPDRDWMWLRTVWTRLDKRAIPLRDKSARLVDATSLLDCGLQAMSDADMGSEPRLCGRAALYRDGLMVALLALRPFRLANLTQIELGRHLVRRGEGYWLSFEASETKTGHPIEAPFPDVLVPQLEQYLRLYRPLFLRNANRNPEHARRLWLSTWGRGLCENMVYRRIMALTRKRLGTAINPHAFRHAAATSIAFADPEHVRITMIILGHTTLAASERYYNLAQAYEASRRYHEHIHALRDGRNGDGI